MSDTHSFFARRADRAGDVDRRRELSNASDLYRRLNDSPMSKVQLIAIALTAILSALEGNDVLSMTFAAPALTHAWHIGEVAIGLLLSSGLLGMVLGSLALSPFADIVGRQPVVLGALVMIVVGGFWSAVSHTVPEMAGSRVLTGIGLGVLVAVITPLAAEFSNARRRPLAVSLVAVGFPIGGVAGGFIAAALLRDYSWPSVFLLKSLIALILVPAVVVFMPETPALLIALGRSDALARVNRYLLRCGHMPVDALPDPPAARSSGYNALFAPGLSSSTVRLAVANSLFVLTAYYFMSWLPQMVANAGFQASTGSLVSAVANLTGIPGGLLLGLAAQRMRVQPLAAASLVAFGVCTAAFGLVPRSLALLASTSALCGFFLMSAISGLYALLIATYPAESRASACGFVFGFGRIAMAVAPYLAGWMFASGLNRSAVSLSFAACTIVSAAILPGPKSQAAHYL